MNLVEQALIQTQVIRDFRVLNSAVLTQLRNGTEVSLVAEAFASREEA